MSKHIHAYISDSKKIQGANNVQLEQINHIPNGSCDVLSFNELNNAPYAQLEAIITGLSRKIKLNSGMMCLEFLNLDKIYNDIAYNKISINELNNALADKSCYFFDKDLGEIISKHNISIKQVIYDGNITKLTVQRSQ